MKRLPSKSASSGKRGKMIRLSKSEMQTMVKQEVQRTMERNEARLQGLIETIQQLESEVDYESSIQKLEARINVVAKKSEAALAYITKTEKKNPLSSLLKVNITGNETERTVPEDMRSDPAVKDAELLQLMENTQKALKKIRSENEAVKADITGLSEELPAPVLTQNGSPNLKVNVRFIKKESADTQEKAHAEEQAQIEEPKAKRVKVECVSPNERNVPKCRDSLEGFTYPPLPSTPFPSVLNMEAASYNIPQRPKVQVVRIRVPPRLSVIWKVEKEDPCAAPMDSYSVYVTTEKVKGSGVFPAWKSLGDVRAIPLPMCVQVKNYKPGHTLCIAVVGKDIFHRYGPFSKVESVVIPD